VSAVLVRIWHIIIKEFIQFRRDRLLMLFLFTFPAMQLVLVAQATGSGVVNLPTAILDQDNSRTSRGLTEALSNTDGLALYYFPTSQGEVKQLIDGGQAMLAVIIPPGFERDLFVPGASPSVQVVADGSNSIAGGEGLRTAEGAINSYLYRWLADSGAIPPPRALHGLELRSTFRFNPSLDHRYYAIPAQLAFIVYQVTLAVAALGLARERELGTLEQLIVTPLRRFELLIGKAIPPLIIGIVDFAFMLLIVVGVYHIPMRGSWGLLFLLTTLFITAEVSWGMMISSISRTQQQSIMFVFMLAMVDVALSGYLVPVENMPLGLKMVSTFSPIRYYMVILRAIMLKGADLTTLWPETLVLAGLGIGIAYLSLRNVGRSFE
jgi:ABC-2 type transport system permease protein